MVNSFTIIMSALATYRVVRLVAIEEGPFSLSQKLRNITDPDQRTWIGRGLACAWCISFWIAPLMVYAATYQTGLLLVSGLAISALVGLAMQCSGLILSYAERLMRRR